MSISFKGYKTNTLTFEAGDSLTVGAPVALSSSGTAVPASNGANFIGICIAIRNGYASVQTDGYVEIAYTGTAPSHGIATLVASTGNKVKAGGENDFVYYKVISVDTTNTKIGFIL